MVNSNGKPAPRRKGPRLYAGLDLGTSKLGLSIVDSSGRLHLTAEVDLPPSRCSRRTGLLVQSPADWIVSSERLFSAARATVDTSNIEAIGVTATTPTMTFLRGDGSLLVDEAVMWSDPNRDGPSDPSGRNAGLRKLAAIARIAPALVRDSSFIVDAPNYLAYWLTGSLTTGAPCLSQKMMWTPGGGFDTRYFQVADPAHILAKFPQRIVATGEVVGPAARQPAAACHVPGGIPVIYAAFDSVAAMIGSGVNMPSGALLVSTGTSVVFYMVPLAISAGLGPWMPRYHLLPGGKCIIAGGFEAGLQSIRLLHERLKLTCKAQSRSRALERMAARGERKEPASTFALPFGGVPLRAPLPEVVLPTAIYSNTHVPSDETTLVAMRRGIVYYVRYALEDLLRRGVAVSEIRLVGGGTRSSSFCRLLADACGLRVRRLSGNAAAMGAALLAAAADMDAATRGQLIGRRRGRTIAPTERMRGFYDEGYGYFSHCLHDALRNSEQGPQCPPEYLI
jgi:xylulokinase